MHVQMDHPFILVFLLHLTQIQLQDSSIQRYQVEAYVERISVTLIRIE